jgi:hypothetical protein
MGLGVLLAIASLGRADNRDATLCTDASRKELVIERAKEIETPVLINTMPLPVLSEQKQPG